MKNAKYKIRYTDADQKIHDVAMIEFFNTKKFKLHYISNTIKLPSFSQNGEYSIESLWMRVPASIRKQEENKQSAFNTFVENFKGKIATDRFEFMVA